MALTSTMFNFDIELSDVDRGVYDNFKCTAARHPSETLEFLVVRVLAFCLEYGPDLAFSKGLSDAEEPAIWAKYPDGRIRTWIEVGVPAANRLHKAAKVAERVAVYTHKPPLALMQSLAKEKIYRAEEIPVYSFDQSFLREAAAGVDRRTKLAASISGRQIYLDISGRSLTSPIEERTAADGWTRNLD